MRGNSPSARMRAGIGPVSIVHGGTSWRSVLARWGLASKGLLYTALGVLAINVAQGDASSGSATPRNAIELVASQPFGQVLLGILTFGLFALAIWHLLMAATGDPVEGSQTSERAKCAVKAVAYAATAITALAVFTREPLSGGSGSGGEQRAAAEIMSWPGGPWLVALLGAAAVGLGLYQLREHAWQGRFMKRLAASRMHGHVHDAVERAGRIGYAARAIVFVIVGVFFGVAAVRQNPNEAVGLSGALQVLAGQSWGPIVLWVVAIGLFLYGCFCFAEAKYRRAT